jgi:hypothetical protein
MILSFPCPRAEPPAVKIVRTFAPLMLLPDLPATCAAVRRGPLASETAVNYAVFRARARFKGTALTFGYALFNDCFTKLRA